MAVLLDDVEDLHDVSVVEPARYLSFPDGPAGRELRFGLAQGGPADLLERHVPVEQLVVGPPDDPHPAAADDRGEPVASGQQAFRLRRVHTRPTTPRDGALTI